MSNEYENVLYDGPDDYEGCMCGEDGCPECDGDCRDCDGDGWVMGEDLAQYDPLWYDEGTTYKCRNCGGSGRAKDMTVW